MISQPRSAHSLFLTAVLLLGWVARLTGAPANDNVADAQRLTGLSGVHTVSLSGATLEPDEQVWLGTRRSVWFRWTAPATGTLLFTVARSATPSAVAFLLRQESDGRTNILTSVASEEVQHHSVDAGRTYWLSVMDRFGTADEATLSFQWLAPPANDAFAQTSFLFGTNAAYIEDLYARYQGDPTSVDADWQAFFGALKDDGAAARFGPRLGEREAPHHVSGAGAHRGIRAPTPRRPAR